MAAWGLSANTMIYYSVLWWTIGSSLMYALIRRIDPVVRASDLVVAFLSGFFGPVVLVYLVKFWNTGAGREKPVSWLPSRNRSS